MTWFKVDDRFALHPKVEALEELGPERHAFAVAAWVLLGSDCALRDDGGVVAPSRLRKLLAAWPEKRRATAISDLVSVGLFDQLGDVTAFHDWEEYRRKDRGPEEKADYERRKKAAQRARSRGNVVDSQNVPGTSTGTVPVTPTRDMSPPVPALPTRPDPTRPDPVESESARAATPDDPFGTESHRAIVHVLLRLYRDAYERATGDAWMGASSAAGFVDTVARWCLTEPDPEAAARRVIEGAFATRRFTARRWPWRWLAEDPAAVASTSTLPTTPIGLAAVTPLPTQPIDDPMPADECF